SLVFRNWNTPLFNENQILTKRNLKSFQRKTIVLDTSYTTSKVQKESILTIEEKKNLNWNYRPMLCGW
ncbi:hypothetical protein, partial [Salmonella sp. S146_54837]|uniref:hypothetical protein n=1 Tax=Salmonella sp. S146_54837 TaxID=2665635 RepID=UPI001CA7CA1C